MAQLARVEFDPNVRVYGNGTYAGIEDVHGVVSLGDEVVLYEPENQIEVQAWVTEIDLHSKLVYFKVDWSSLRAMEEPRATSAEPEVTSWAVVAGNYMPRARHRSSRRISARAGRIDNDGATLTAGTTTLVHGVAR
ncbi:MULTISPECIES: hypothetical protein [Micromonospora]|uniref:Uncharacterized protein n=1 Tax=Micromonospora aurantiaca (nom. illeg.) TaxID=47850 RepID=A0ABQ6UET9_9ACTN|nr:hypothetical protein [Micromonospora aurantiaca]KAB1110783.1 hypothetical protein F6X54_17575 [Micromonospora aurantiaca]UFN94860.1 hypothetical protein LF814_01415 [Micromonospora aurantiaca]